MLTWQTLKLAGTDIFAHFKRGAIAYVVISIFGLGVVGLFTLVGAVRGVNRVQKALQDAE